MSARRAALWLAQAIALTSCAGSDEGSGPGTCTETRDCARGQACVSGTCQELVPDSAAPDVAVDSTLIIEPEDAELLDDAANDAIVADTSPVDAGPDGGAPAMDAAAPAPDMDVGPCQPGARQDCGESVGRCRRGTQICGDDGAWGPCEGGVAPEPEVCNAADDDCNGVIDDGFDVGGECDGIGACGVGVFECRSTVQTRCSTDPGGSQAEDGAEACNGEDDDCDGTVDEGLMVGQACVGECGPGQLECGPGDMIQCDTDAGGTRSEPTPEVCDRRDNDCDGTLDEGFDVGGACDGTGACGLGVLQCDDEGRARCSTDPGGPDYNGGPEACNGVDDDCDGEVDDGLGVGGACEGAGACGMGVVECSPEGDLRCSTDPGGTQSEVGLERCNFEDDDCDGEVDEGLGIGAACPAVGICPAGLNECDDDGSVRCSTGPGGSADASRLELCDGEDDDCDGAVDEAFDVGGRCVGLGDCGVGAGECADDGGFVCSTEPGGRDDRSGPETCDGADNDCDGTIDEGAACGGDTCEAAPPLVADRLQAGNTTELADDYPTSSCLGASSGPDQAFRVDVPAAGAYIIGVAPLDDQYSPLFWLTADCENNSRACVPNSGQQRGDPGQPRAGRVNLSARTYSLIVDSRDPQTGGPFLASARPAADGEACNTAIPLTVPGRFVGTTQDRDNDFAGAQCPAGTVTTGPDQVFELTLDARTDLRITASPGQISGAAQPNLVLSVSSRCNDIDNNCARGVNARGVGEPEILDVSLDAGTWYVIVDHPGNPGGPFFLEITER